MSQRDRATKHAGNAQIDHHEARWFTKGTAAAVKRTAKREMRKAQRALADAEIAEGRTNAAQSEGERSAAGDASARDLGKPDAVTHSD